MDEQIAAASPDSGAKPAKPSDAFGDPDRRRGMLSFLTWAFFLSEAFKSMQAEAAGVKAADDLDGANSAASLTDAKPQELPADPSAYNEWPVALPVDPIGKFPAAGHLPQIPEVNLSEPDDFSMARGRVDGPSAFGGGGGGGHWAGGGTAGPAEANPNMQAEVGNPLVGVGLHQEPGDGLDMNVNLSLPSVGDTLGIVGSPVLTLNSIVSETVLPVVSDLTTVVSSAVNSLTAGLLGGVLGSSGLINILGSPGGQEGGNELFSGGKYTDYHLGLQAGDTAAMDPGGHDTVGVDLDVADLAGGLIPALGHINNGGSHDAATPSLVLPSAVDELLLRGPLDILT